MKPARFDYIRPDTAREAQAVLAQYGHDARILAGGQSLLAMLNMRLAEPKVLVDISRMTELAYIRIDGDRLAIGAAATQGALEAYPALREHVPLAALALPWISHFQIKNKGTVCGSIAHADPSAELPLVLAALGGEVVLASASARRTLAPDDYFRGMLQTTCAPDEMIVEIRLPLRAPNVGYAFREVALRHGDFALVALAAVAAPDTLSLTVGGVADRPVMRRWPRLDGVVLEHALNDFAWALGAEDDAHASAQYRRHLVRVLGHKVLLEAQQ
ncbi:MAG: FAD binding domain-containing protein [Pseudomonadota bacterium]|nr:FAD binding domain-containing protein [Pseudomonadota bacterium]